MKYRCCNCENVFSDEDVSVKGSECYETGFSCPNCQQNIQKSESKNLNIKGINLVILSFVVGVAGNAMWAEWFLNLTGRLWWEAAFLSFIASIVIVIFLNLNNKEALIAQTELLVSDSDDISA